MEEEVHFTTFDWVASDNANLFYDCPKCKKRVCQNLYTGHITVIEEGTEADNLLLIHIGGMGNLKMQPPDIEVNDAN